MAIGTTGAIDPVTGERTESQFEYTPVDPNDYAMQQVFQQSQQAFYPPPAPHGNTPYWENPRTYYPQQPEIDPIAQAKAATMAAQKFIAFRGYQSDLKEGMAAADAFAKWGPMLVQDTSFAPSIKALTPPPTGQWVSPNPATQQPGFYQGQGPSGSRAYFPPESSVVRPDVNAEANVRTIGNRRVYVNPRTGAMTFLDEKANEWDKIDYTTAAAAAKDAQKIINNPSAMTDEKVAAEKTLADAAKRMAEIKAPKATESKQSEMPSVGEVRKGYRFKGGNPALADNWQKL